MWKIDGTFDDSNNTGKRIAYTVEVAKNRFVDVMNCVDQGNLFYAMELEDGTLVYDENGDSVDFTVNEKDLVAFVKKFVSMKTSFISFVEEKLTERGDKNIFISNVRLLGNDAIFADVYYTWFLNGWEKQVEQKDWVAVFKDEKWHSPHVW